jgi:GH24 family phage-related lysozyme (muramidase)
MKINVIRKEYTPKSTIGELYVDGKFECYALEDRIRALKVPGTTAIPSGNFEVVVTWSNRFKRPLPLLMNVPNYEGVRIHTGNKDEDTEGCLLVGKTKQRDFVGGSKDAFSELLPKIQEALQREKVFLDIVQENAPAELLARATPPMARAPRGLVPRAASPAEAKPAFSEKALDLIIGFEGLNQPGKWPGAASGITVGYGYDLGHVTAEKFESDWAGCFTPEQFARLREAIGRKGTDAEALEKRLADIKCKPADSRRILLECSIPEYAERTRQAFPGFDELPLDAQGALVSLVYNRGAGMKDSAGSDNRLEMRVIRELVPSGNLAGIAAQLRAMKRLWMGKNMAGLLRRRDAEAALVESSMAPAMARAMARSFGVAARGAPVKRRAAKKPATAKVKAPKKKAPARAAAKAKPATAKPAARKKSAAKKAAPKKSAAKKAAPKKATVKKAAPKRAARKTVAGKQPTRKSAATPVMRGH